MIIIILFLIAHWYLSLFSQTFFQHRYAAHGAFTMRRINSWLSGLLWIGAYSCLYVEFAPSFWFLLILPLHIAMGPVHGVIINWFAHKYGHINYRANNTSRNLFKID